MTYVDLHAHSTASDGTTPPEDLARLAVEAGLSAFALTDHDTIAGLPEAAVAAKSAGVDFLPGIEVSCEIPRPGTMHILGYGVNAESDVLRRMSEQLIAARDDRNPRIIRRLNELGIDITIEEAERQAGGGVVGRPHIAASLVAKGHVPTIKAAFDRYLGQGGAAYFDKERLPYAKAFELIRAARGLPVLAHPVQLRLTDDEALVALVARLRDAGLAGIEVIHSDHETADVEKFITIAERFGLLKTGGSDFHGTNKKDIHLGVARGRRIPREYLDTLLDRLSSKT